MDGELPQTIQLSPINPPQPAPTQALCDPHTLVLVTYEWRLPEVREALLTAANNRFGYVRVMSQDELPEGWRTTHVETFEMRLAAEGEGAA
jgi:hypothetical protein